MIFFFVKLRPKPQIIFLVVDALTLMVVHMGENTKE